MTIAMTFSRPAVAAVLLLLTFSATLPIPGASELAPAPQTTSKNQEVTTESTMAFTAPSPASTSSSVSTSEPDKPLGTCCKQRLDNGECASLVATNPDLYYNEHTPSGTDTWCGIDDCACGVTNSCPGDEKNCGYNSPDDPVGLPCICAADCYLDGRCCADYTTVCSSTTPPEEVPAPSPSTTSTVPPTTTTDNSIVTQRTTTTAATATTTSLRNGTDTLGTGDNTVIIVASVSVVVVVVVIVLVIFTVKHIKKKQAESKPMFGSSTSNEYDAPSAGSAGSSPGVTSPGDVELSTRAKSYESSRRGSSKRSKKKSKKHRSKTPRAKTTLQAAVDEPEGADGFGTGDAEPGPAAAAADPPAAASSSSKKKKKSRKHSKRSRRTPQSASRSPVATTPHADDDVFASPTHHNFEL